ncbi:MAG: sensor histidine kinase, partial [Bacteroidales bacterium]
IINSNAYHLLDIINNIIDVAKIESGQIDMNSEPVDLAELFLGLQGLFMTDSPKVQLRFLEPDISVFTGDKIKIKQILVNLISNAIKYTSEGYIEVSAFREGGSLVFRVKDTGAGIPSEDQPHIFERFMKGSNGRWRSRGGTGLGLSIVKAYVEKMGGRVWFTSRWKHGSVFYFSIPLIVD